jgi:hypothetical protein
MNKQRLMIAVLLLLAFGGLPAGQEQEPPVRERPQDPEPLYVRLTLYPTASLSRYDYNNDVDFYEVRAYADVRRGSPEGPAVTDARITVLGEALDIQAGHYQKRVVVEQDALPQEVDFELAAGGRTVFREKIIIPAWLVLQEPRPAILDRGRDLTIRWRFSRFSAPVDVSAYDFRRGGEFFSREHAAETEFVVPGDKVPAETTLRIIAMQSWLYKRFLRGEGLARGSEVNVIPWSQVFIRTR